MSTYFITRTVDLDQKCSYHLFKTQSKIFCFNKTKNFYHEPDGPTTYLKSKRNEIISIRDTGLLSRDIETNELNFQDFSGHSHSLNFICGQSTTVFNSKYVINVTEKYQVELAFLQENF